MTLTSEDKAAILRSINIDPQLSNDERRQLSQALSSAAQWQSFAAGAMGAAAGYSIAKFLKMSKTAQILITLAGFGVGKYLLDNSQNSGKFMEYNKKLKGYKINS